MPQLIGPRTRWPWLQREDGDRLAYGQKPKKNHWLAPSDAEQGWQDDAETEEGAPKDAMLLAFKIPDGPYSDETFKLVHHAIDIAEAIHSTASVFGVELGGLLGLGIEAVAPFVAAIGSWLALGAGYAEARAIVARRRTRTGFAIGVVTGADRRQWSYVKRLFWESQPEANSFDEGAGRVAQNAYNTGLACGFIQGRQVAQNQKKWEFFWKSIGRALSPGDLMQYGGDRKTWPDRSWQDYYYRVGGIFIKLYVQ